MILEETHYYPFGLTMAGIRSKAVEFGGAENKIKFVGQEIQDALDLDWYQMKFRDMDPQIGRFWQIDPIASKYTSNGTYSYAENDVIRSIDLEGLEKYIITKKPLNSQGLKKVVVTMEVNKNKELINQGLTDKEAYRINYDLKGKGKSETGNATEGEKFIAEKGAVEGSGIVKNRTEIKDENGERQTRPIQNDESLVQSQGYEQSLMINENPNENASQVANLVSNSIKDFTKIASGTVNVNKEMVLNIDINPSDKLIKTVIKALRKQFPSMKIIVSDKKENKKNYSQWQISAVN